MISVGSALLTPPQNTTGTAPASNSEPASKKNEVKSTTSPEEVGKLEQATQPLAPKSFNALLQSQEESDSSTAVEGELTEEEQKQVQELKQTDREVRAHEAAHKTAGGSVAGSVSFETVTGPDGREYAVAGEVQIDASPVANNPESTIRRMDQVIRAALAPADPSPQDRAVAAQAQQAKIQAQQEVAEKRAGEQEERSKNNKLGILSQAEDLQQEESGVEQSGSGDSSLASSTEIVSILFGN